MSVVDKRKHRVVVGGVLVCLIVSHNHALDLFHIVYFKHLQRALINDVLEAWLAGASVVSVVWEEQFAVDHFSVVVALLERSCGVVSAHKNHAEVGVREAGVDVEEEISGASG
jgi:hypothetical protein